MDEIDPRVIQAFSFVEKNEMWDAINILLDASIDVEVTYAISGDTQGEDRTQADPAHLCCAGLFFAVYSHNSFLVLAFQNLSVVWIDLKLPVCL